MRFTITFAIVASVQICVTMLLKCCALKDQCASLSLYANAYVNTHGSDLHIVIHALKGVPMQLSLFMPGAAVQHGKGLVFCCCVAVGPWSLHVGTRFV